MAYWKDDLVSITRDKFGIPHSFNDEPALIFESGTLIWRTNGATDRKTGPAIIVGETDDELIQEYKGLKKLWWIDGEYVPGIEEWLTEMSIDITNLSEDDRTMFTIRWGFTP